MSQHWSCVLSNSVQCHDIDLMSRQCRGDVATSPDAATLKFLCRDIT